MKILICLALLFSKSAFATSTIKVDGSSTVFPITEAVSEEFMKGNKGEVRVTVGVSGTGGGFKKFCRGETDLQDASRPIMKQEMDACKAAGVKYYELPIAYDAITIIVSPKNTWLKQITVNELKKIWEPEAQGKIKKWNQVNPAWPDAPLNLYGPSADNGTFDYFTEAIMDKAKASRGDYTASVDHNARVIGVEEDKNALGYIPYAYYEPNKSKIKAIPVIGGAKAPKKTAVLPSHSTVVNGTYFPLSRPIFIYVNSKSSEREDVKGFTKFYLNGAAKLAEQVKYIALPPKAYAMANKNFDGKKMGTVFKGSPQVGVKIEDLLKREAQH